jgi:hypothetical protein
MSEANTACRLCGENSPQVRTAHILGKYEISYYLCPQCDLLQTEAPYWLNEAYQDSISMQDTGLMHRNLMVSRRVAVFCRRHGLAASPALDFAGGYGILVRMLRDLGLDFSWTDKYSANLVARGFEAEPGRHYEVITAFEVLEHFDHPSAQIGEILADRDPEYFLFETTLRPDGSVPGSEWKYYAVDTGQHIAFYSRKTLSFIAERHGRHYWNQGRLQVISKQPRAASWRSLVRLPWALWKVWFPDAIPFIRRDQGLMEARARASRTADSASTDVNVSK